MNSERIHTLDTSIKVKFEESCQSPSLKADYAFISAELEKTDLEFQHHFFSISSLPYLREINLPTIQPLPQSLQTKINVRQALEFSAHVIKSQPNWLHGVFQIYSGQNSVSLDILNIYSHFSGSGLEIEKLDDLLNSLLLSSQINLSTLYTFAKVTGRKRLSAVENFVNLQCCLQQFPRVLFPEILGFTLACFYYPTLMELCFPHHNFNDQFFKIRQQRAEQLIPKINDCIIRFIQSITENADLVWTRVQTGYWLYFYQLKCCRDAWCEEFGRHKTDAQAIAELLLRKSPAAMGHHQTIKLQGQPLDEWFSGLPNNSREFLQALANSSYIDLLHPEKSKLLELFSFNGSMFGVMSEQELNLMRRWIKSGCAQESSARFVQSSDNKLALAIQPLERKTPNNGLSKVKCFEKMSNRQLYYYLVNADIFPESVTARKNKIKRLLAVCKHVNRLPLIDYSHKAFEKFLENIYETEINAYQPLKDKPKISNRAYIWGIRQVAPMILLDGCWLQNSLKLQNVYPHIAELLFKIYSDELGNGVYQQSHPVVFQQLLDSLSINLPPVYCQSFAQQSGFIDSAFDLPVFMLSLSHHPVAYLPELLGLNMAIEISGLGKGYRQLVDDWRYWGINPKIASLHISIDNVVSGHTLLAKQAIQLYLEEIYQKNQSREQVNHHWQRIYTGYASLRFFGLRFRCRLPVAYLGNMLKKHE